MPKQQLEVRRAAASEIEEISEVLADAFEDYPWTRWTVDAEDHRVRIRSLQRLALAELAVPYGQVWVSFDSTGAVASAAAWMDPGLSPSPDALAVVASETAVLEGDRHAQSTSAQLLVDPLRPTSPHFYLGTVGTRPDCQGSGHGRSVLQPVLDLADRQHTECYLETSAASNVGFYESLGFRVSGEAALPEGGPHVWAMLRSGQPARSPRVAPPRQSP